ncbi:MAG TPA: ABC transporter ATP-binding protein [Deinococcales bacterium]|nr:ABC transporter ATP-binding protein [Deinococcales bacterium]
MHISFENVSKSFSGRAGRVHALEDVSLHVRSGEVLCLVGPSGCGKSTLLNMLAGFDRPSGGAVLLDGVPVGPPSLERTMLFQEAALFPWLSVRENIEFGLRSQRLGPRERRDRVEELLALVRLEGFADAQPHELSGGMRQRVALARALAPRPRVLLMDEPFAALDAITRDHLLAELERIWAETGATILFVTHNVPEAVTIGTRVVVLSGRPGRVRRDVDLTHLARPRRLGERGVGSAIAAVQEALRDASEPVLLPGLLEAAS